MPVKSGRSFGQVDQWSGDLGVVGDEVSIESRESQEGSHVSDVPRLWPVRYAFDLCWVHLDCPSLKYDSEKLDMVLLKLALLGFQIEVVLFQFVQDAVNTFSVFGEVGVRMYQDVVHVY